MAGYRLSEQADARIDDIYEHSLTMFGGDQAKRYLLGLWDTLKALTQFPESGIDCSGLGAGLRSRVYGRHTIYYRIGADHILVIDILHQSMVPEHHLPRED